MLLNALKTEISSSMIANDAKFEEILKHWKIVTGWPWEIDKLRNEGLTFIQR